MRALEGKTARERLFSSGERYLDYGFENPHDYKVIFSSWEHLELGVHAPDRRAEGEHAPLFRFLLDRIRECRPDLDDAQKLFQHGLLFWAQCHGLVMIYLTGAGRKMMPFEQYRALCSAQLQLLLSGFLQD
jgi:hypothetical protein